MKILGTAVILVAMAAAQNPGPPARPANTPQGALQIVSPSAGQVLRQDYVVVKVEPTNRGIAGGPPNFRVRLDGREPVITPFDEYTFTGLAPGLHVATVELVNANNTPVAGTRSEVQFNVVPPPAANSAAKTRTGPQPNSADGNQNLPDARSALPLLSVIGFGALLGGIASALRTR